MWDNGFNVQPTIIVYNNATKMSQIFLNDNCNLVELTRILGNLIPQFFNRELIVTCCMNNLGSLCQFAHENESHT